MNLVPASQTSKSNEEIVIEQFPEAKIKAVQLMVKIVKNHVLMNSMIRWIENGFMQVQDGCVSPIPEKEEVLECSSIEKDYNHYLHPITEESLGDLDNENYSSENKLKKRREFKLEKLR